MIYNCFLCFLRSASRFSLSLTKLKQLRWLPVKFRFHFKIIMYSHFQKPKIQPTCSITNLLVKKSTLHNKYTFFITPIKLRLSESVLYIGSDFLEGSVCAHKKYPNNFNTPKIRPTKI